MNDTSYHEPLSDADFTELLIRHMVLSPEVYSKAKYFNVTGSDMMLNDTFGSVLYKELIDIINSVDDKPVSAQSVFLGLKRRFDDGILNEGLKESTVEFLEYVFSDRPLEKPEWFDGKLAEFIKKKRAKKLISLYSDDVDTLTRELSKLNVELNHDSELSKPRIVNPFLAPMFKTKTAMIGTGLSKLDEKLDGGLLLGEYALLIGFSGGGKTAVGSNIIGLSAEGGRPSVYISCEEHEREIAQRMYSRVYRIPYRQLRQGSANLELECKFNSELKSAKQEQLSRNLCLFGLKGVENITANYLYELLVQHYEKTGFIPEIIMLDQMQFITPIAEVRKGAPDWEKEKQVSIELDQLSHKPIGGKNFLLWVQHQAKGKTKAWFNRDEIDGFKGIIQKSDLVVGCGRQNERSNEINLFSLKVRHSADFQLTLKTEFEYMTVTSTQVSDTLPETPDSTTMTIVNHAPIQHQSVQ
jgi:hypothetical protein